MCAQAVRQLARAGKSVHGRRGPGGAYGAVGLSIASLGLGASELCAHAVRQLERLWTAWGQALAPGARGRPVWGQTACSASPAHVTLAMAAAGLGRVGQAGVAAFRQPLFDRRQPQQGLGPCAVVVDQPGGGVRYIFVRLACDCKRRAFANARPAATADTCSRPAAPVLAHSARGRSQCMADKHPCCCSRQVPPASHSAAPVLAYKAC